MDSVQERNESESGDEKDLGKEEIDPVKEDREKQFKDNFDEIDKLLYGILKRHTDEQSNITKVRDLLKTIDEHVQDLLQTSSSDSVIASLHPESLSIPWKKLGEGNFGQVFESKLKGSRVAVKIFKEEAKSQIRESRLLRYLSHDNIIAYRGMGYITSAEQENTLVQGSQNVDSRTIDSGHSTASESSDLMAESMYPKMFFVMEFIEHNLFQYIAGLETHERQGLSASKAWDVGVQIVGALSYLHSLKIAHRDLKPDNILIQVGPNRFVIKIADFGLSWRGDQINNQIRYQSGTSSGISGFSVNIRWGPPEFKEESSSSEKPKLPTLEDQKRGDIYCLGLVLAFAISGVKPFAEWSSVSLDDHELDDVCLPVPVESLPEGCLGKAIQDCTNIIPGERPSIDDVVDKYFTGLNPYVVYAAEGELFSCGFMTKTDIFVADSCINRDATQEGYFKSKERPVGYDHNDLKCRIEVGSIPCRDRYESWDKEDKYFELYQRFKQDAYNKIIDNNPTVALKQLLFARPGEEECQTVVMNFKQSEYVHHKAMRSIWMSLSEQERKNALPNKAEVNPFYSNTFGLHVAVLTDEGPGNPPQFVFPQRSNRVGMSSPGAFTCGAVESASTPDYIEDRTKVDFVNTAARGLREEIGLDLTGSDLDAICLTTIYLKVDTHEWGLCGFVDLSDERIKDENRISAESIKDRFSSGPKDKFEHQRLHFVPFELESMVNFVFEKHEYFASSAKLVVVKVLQAYFGWSAVQNEFESRLLDN